jgi:hypothetical protein
MASCDVCGTTVENSSRWSHLVPQDWYEVETPLARRTDSDDGRVWACSPGCLLTAALDLFNKSAGRSTQWEHVPMTAPGSPVVHAVALGPWRDHSDGRTLTACSAMRLHQLVPASGDRLRPCKRCVPIVERFEPGAWFVPAGGAA